MTFVLSNKLQEYYVDRERQLNLHILIYDIVTQNVDERRRMAGSDLRRDRRYRED